MPNLQAKIQATRLLEEVDGPESIKPVLTRKQRSTEHLPLQGEGMALVGDYVESLFPSIRDIEAAIMAQVALETSNIDVDGFDMHVALRYFRIVGGKVYLSKIGLGV